jgi:hypothetical protein
LRSTNLHYGGKITGNTAKNAPLQLFQADAYLMCNLWKNKLKAAYGKASRARGKENPDSGAAADDDSDEEGDQFFVAYPPPPEPESGVEGRGETSQR